MSATFAVDLFCDGAQEDGQQCNQWTVELTQCGSSGNPPRVREMRALAARHGWSYVKGRDYCRDCTHRRAEEST